MGLVCHEQVCYGPEEVPAQLVNLGLFTTLAALTLDEAPPPPLAHPSTTSEVGPPAARQVAGLGSTPVEQVEAPAKLNDPPATVETPQHGAVPTQGGDGTGPVRDSATAKLLAAARNLAVPLPRRNQVLVVVESMGRFRDPEAQAALLSPLTRLSQRYLVEVGSVPFHGVTWRGELRELCGARFIPPSQYEMPKDSTRTYPECLPALLAKRGYRTVAFHGFDPDMYNRSSWYPSVGFQQMYFRDDLAVDGVQHNCGVFWHGTCDAVVARRLDQELRDSSTGSPRFLHWMTLNSHLPDSAALSERTDFDCDRYAATTQDPATCRHAWALSVALQAMAELASEPELPPTDFIVVGDHAPPWATRRLGEAFDRKLVPYVTLTWKGE
jgi:hypothetical protein